MQDFRDLSKERHKWQSVSVLVLVSSGKRMVEQVMLPLISPRTTLFHPNMTLGDLDAEL